MNLCVVEEARLKVQYCIIGEQLKAVKLKKQQLMQRLRDAAVGGLAAVGECQRCRLLSAQVEALNRRLAAVPPRAAAVAQPRRVPRRRRLEANDDVEPNTDDSVRIVGEDVA